ncbi:MAG: VOC family protein [Acidobacteriota bacterium]
MIEIYRIILPVQDIERAAAFYGAVLGQAGERVSPGRHYFRCGPVVLACYDPIADGDDLYGGWVHHPNQYVYFAVDDLELTLARVITAGGRPTSGIDEMPWGERLFYAIDPENNPISFVDRRTTFTGSHTGTPAPPGSDAA